MDAVLNWLWQGAVVATALSLMLLALDRTRANIRYVVCWVGALAVIGLPVMPMLRFAAPAGMADVPQNGAIVALPDAWWTSGHVILAAAVLWASLQVLRLLSAGLAIRRARRRARPFPAQLERRLPPPWRAP